MDAKVIETLDKVVRKVAVDAKAKADNAYTIEAEYAALKKSKPLTNSQEIERIKKHLGLV
jgi:hypothetical protein